MWGILASGVQLEPLALKIEWDGILANIGREDLPELILGDLACTCGVKEAECNLVLCVGKGQQVLENDTIWSEEESNVVMSKRGKESSQLG